VTRPKHFHLGAYAPRLASFLLVSRESARDNSADVVAAVQRSRPVIEVRNLVKSFGDKDAVKGISFTIHPGQATGYLGPNGAGKSTTVKIIAGVLQPTAGEVKVCGFDVVKQPLEVKRRIGYVPENAALYDTLSANEYLSLVAELYQVDRATAALRIGQLLDAFELLPAADQQIETLSKGMRQKVLLIGALIHDPPVILLDEPLNGLDVNAAMTFRRLLERLLQNGKTLLFCSHILEVIERLCGRVIVIDRGRIVADDLTAKLLAGHPQGTLEAVFQSLTHSNQSDDSVRDLLWTGPEGN
jgi:ABC-2 type transport system ATP-binding protein